VNWLNRRLFTTSKDRSKFAVFSFMLGASLFVYIFFGASIYLATFFHSDFAYLFYPLIVTALGGSFLGSLLSVFLTTSSA